MTIMIRPAAVRLNVSAADSRTDGAATEDVLGLMASSLAHDVNNILQIVAGNLALLSREGVADRSRHRIENSLTAIQTGVELTGGVLEYCRQRTWSARASTLVAAGEIVAMGPLVRDTAGEGIEVIAAIADDLWPIRTDVHRLRNVLINLAANARDAMGGRGHLLIGARNVSCSLFGEQVWLTVADDGPGIPHEILEHVFTPFYTTKSHGTGLGLAIVAEFARASAADVVVESRPGLGTSITIEFPRQG